MTESLANSDQGDQPLRLDHFLKIHGISESGGHAKAMIQGGEVKLNGIVETRRRKKLATGDVVEVFGKKFAVREL
jgi:ribosome-associated protein